MRPGGACAGAFSSPSKGALKGTVASRMHLSKARAIWLRLWCSHPPSRRGAGQCALMLRRIPWRVPLTETPMKLLHIFVRASLSLSRLSLAECRYGVVEPQPLWRAPRTRTRSRSPDALSCNARPTIPAKAQMACQRWQDDDKHRADQGASATKTASSSPLRNA